MPLILASCKPQPNWMPKKPKLMFQICQKLRRGLFIGPIPVFDLGGQHCAISCTQHFVIGTQSDPFSCSRRGSASNFVVQHCVRECCLVSSGAYDPRQCLGSFLRIPSRFRRWSFKFCLAPDEVPRYHLASADGVSSSP